MRVYKANGVFVLGGIPQYTSVLRTEGAVEQQLRRANDSGALPISWRVPFFDPRFNTKTFYQKQGWDAVSGKYDFRAKKNLGRGLLK